MDNLKNDNYYIQRRIVDLKVVYDTIKNDIPELLDQILSC